MCVALSRLEERHEVDVDEKKTGCRQREDAHEAN
jgi:hypothetical protein